MVIENIDCINVHIKSYFGRMNRYLNPLLPFTVLYWAYWGLPPFFAYGGFFEMFEKNCHKLASTML